MRRTVIASLVIVGGLATAGVAYAGNQPPDPTVAVTRGAVTGAPAPEAAGGKAGVRKGAIHGDLLVRGQDGSTRTVTFDRGKVSSVSGSSITIERPDGVSVSADLTDETTFNGTPRDQLASGTPVMVVSEGHTATRVVGKGARAQKVCANPGEGRRGRIKDRLCQRLEQRQGPVAGRSSLVDDGSETIVS